ncbi:DMT family transporter [Primorskyibacter sp. S187A]|uniref:DMT family transporter n=1 Tax=Primorskyibacter sp. S187A TaxID=3415130 RepID=UPI003C7BE679
MTPYAQRPLIAVGLMLLATVFIAGTTLLAKALGTDTLGAPLHPLQITSARFAFAFMGIASVAAVARLKIGKIHWPWHIARTILGGTGVTLMFASVAFIPLSDATAISFMNPVFAMLLAIPLLGERVGPWRWLAVVLAFAGALILLRPGMGVIQFGALLALGAALVLGFEIIVIKRLSSMEPAFQILFVNNCIGMLLIAGPAFVVWTSPTGAQWAAMAALGLMMACAQACFVNSMARADASFVVPFSYATLIFAALYDGAIFGVWPDGISILGAVTIIAGAVLLAWRESRARRPLVPRAPET